MPKKRTVMRRVTPRIPEVMLNVMANEPTEVMVQKLQMFYKGVYENSIAYMLAKHADTGEEIEVLVGYDLDPETNKIDAYPLARLLSKEEARKIRAPDGRGNFSDGEERPIQSND